MITFRTLRWMLLLVLIAAGCGGAYVWKLWSESDAILRAALVNKLQEVAPGWDIELGRIGFDYQGRVCISDAKLRVGEEHKVLLEIPETVIVINREKLVDKEAVIELVRILRPRVVLERDSSGHWNIEGLPPRPPSHGPVSEIQIEQATLVLRFAPLAYDRIDEAQDGFEVVPASATVTAPATKTEIVLNNVDVRLIPSGKRKFLIKTTGGFDLSAGLTAEGQWDCDSASWKATGTFKDLKIGTTLMDLLAGISPSVQQGLGAVRTKMEHLLAERRQPAEPRRDLGLAATADVNFQLEQPEGPNALIAQGNVELHTGEITNPLLPWPLYDLQGRVEYEGGQVTIRQLAGHNGKTTASMGGFVFVGGEAPSGELKFNLGDVTLDSRVQDCLTGGLARAYQALHATGQADLQVLFQSDGTAPWKHGGVITLKNCTVEHANFPYHVDAVGGQVTITGKERVDLDVHGIAGGRPVTLTGKITNPGPDGEVVLDIRGTGLRIDERLRNACVPKVQAILDHLRIAGTFSGHVRISRPAGPHEVYTPYIVAELRNCTAAPKSFPYALSDLSAKLEGGGLDWKISDIQARHEGAIIRAAAGTCADPRGRCQLVLKVSAADVPIDQQLQGALTEQWQKLWREFSPTGKVNIGALLEWTEGGAPSIQMNAKINDGTMLMQSFPYPLDSVNADVTVGPGWLRIKSFSGRHHETRVVFTGSGDFSNPTAWRVNLANIVVDDLDPERRFRKALPKTLREVIESLDPRGKVSLTGEIDFLGTQGQQETVITAAWNLEVIHSGTALTAGVDLEDVFGRARIEGTWDGENVTAKGTIDLDSITFRGHQLLKVRGPVSVNGNQLVIGSKVAVNGDHQLDGGPPVDNEGRMTAEFVGGLLGLDGVVKLQEKTSYHVRITLAGGLLERYSDLYLPGQKQLKGVMNGWVDLFGSGNSANKLEGRGRLLISPAALYELPIFVAILSIPSFAPLDKTAFRTAGFDFDVGGGQFLFRRIELIGDTMSLLGRGFVRFEGNVGLHFYSRNGRNRIIIPLVREAIEEATRGWLEVSVEGTINKPTARIRTLPQLDDALRGFLGGLGKREPSETAKPKKGRKDRDRAPTAGAAPSRN